MLQDFAASLASAGDADSTQDTYSGGGIERAVFAGSAVLGGAGAVAIAPAAVSAIGFASTGIASGSTAAGWMSSVAIANGGGVPAWSFVAGLQSVGAAGLSTWTAAGMTVLGAAAFGGAVIGVGVFKLRNYFHT